MSYLLAGSIEELNSLGKEEIINRMKERQVSLGQEKSKNSEVRSWRSSLYPLIRSLGEDKAFNNLYLIAEYNLSIEYRIDVLLLGYSAISIDKKLAIIVELKQWSGIENSDNIDSDYVWIKTSNGSERRLHPIKQTMNYKKQLIEYHSEVYNENIDVEAIQYLHNFINKESLFEGEYEKFKLDRSSLFVHNEIEGLKNYLYNVFDLNHEAHSVFESFDQGYYLLSQKGFKALKSLIQDNERVIQMLDEQKSASKKIAELIESFVNEPRDIFITVSGSAGTGKTYLGMEAIILAAESNNEIEVEDCIFTLAKNRTLKAVIDGEANFKWPYLKYIKRDKYKLIVIDEAHRIEDLDNVFEKLFDKSKKHKIVIFLQDDRQRVFLKEKGTIDCIVDKIKSLGNTCHHHINLSTEQRAGNQSNYAKNIQKLLYFDDSPQFSKATSFRLNTEKSLHEIDNILKDYISQGYTARWYASYDWKWLTENIQDEKNITTEELKNLNYDINIKDNGSTFKKYWNPKSSQYEWYKGMPCIIRLNDSSLTKTIEAIDQVGCVHTAQGLEYDYVGFIWYKDLYWDEHSNRWVFSFKEVYCEKNKKWLFQIEHLEDDWFTNQANNYINDNKGSKGSTEEVLNLILNQYYILLTRARKGVYIWFEDEATKRKFDSIMTVE